MVLIVPILLGLVGIILVLAWSIGLGWLLSHLLPFSLFEGSLLAMIASVVVGGVASRILSSSIDIPFMEPEEDDDDSLELTAYTIPATRFYQSLADQTWEAWVRFEIANRMDDALMQSPRVTGRLDAAQRQELAIRLADIGVALLKAKTGRGKQIRTRLKDWQQQMTRQGLKPYDEPILRLAMSTLHHALALPMIENVIRVKLWEKPAAMFDLVK